MLEPIELPSIAFAIICVLCFGLGVALTLVVKKFT